MIALLDTSEDLLVCRKELGCKVEQLLTPLTMFRRQPLYLHKKYSIDNGSFGEGFKAGPFKALLLREKDAISQCRFVAVPDVVCRRKGDGAARRTLEVFQHFRYKLSGWPLALVAQDGIEDLEIPWEGFGTLFIGGTTAFKASAEVVALIRAAQAMGKWVHVGRVNTPGRFTYFDELGADSIDGTGLSQYTHMREEIWKRYNQPNLLTDLAPSADESSVPSDSISSIAGIADEITAEHTSVEGA